MDHKIEFFWVFLEFFVYILLKVATIKWLTILSIPAQTPYLELSSFVSYTPKYSLEGMHQYFWFFYGAIHKGNLVSETSVFGWVLPGIPSHAQFCPDLSRIWMVRGQHGELLKIIQNEILNEICENKSVLSSYISFELLTNIICPPTRLEDSLIINISGTKQSML